MSKSITPAERKKLGEVELPTELFTSYQVVSEEIARLTAIQETLREGIETRLGRNEYGLVDGEPVLRWQHTTFRRIDNDLLRENVEPDILALCYTEKHGRRLTLTTGS